MALTWSFTKTLFPNNVICMDSISHIFGGGTNQPRTIKKWQIEQLWVCTVLKNYGLGIDHIHKLEGKNCLHVKWRIR